MRQKGKWISELQVGLLYGLGSLGYTKKPCLKTTQHNTTQNMSKLSLVK